MRHVPRPRCFSSRTTCSIWALGYTSGCLLAVYYKEITVGFSTDLGADDDPVARTLLIILVVVLDIV